MGTLACEFEKVETYKYGPRVRPRIEVFLVYLPEVKTWGMVIERKDKRTITKVGYSKKAARALFDKTVEHIRNGGEIREKRFI